MVRKVQARYEKSMVRKVHKWYETSMVRNVYGTKSLAFVRDRGRGRGGLGLGIGIGLGLGIARDSRKSRQKNGKKRHTFVKIAKITAKSRQVI